MASAGETSARPHFSLASGTVDRPTHPEGAKPSQWLGSRPGAPLLSRHRSVGGQHSAVPPRSFAKLRSDNDQTKHPGSRVRAGSLQVDIPTLQWTKVHHVPPDRPKPGRRSCGGCARCLQIGRRKATSRRDSVGRGNGRSCGQRTREWTADIAANGPQERSA
jgi:hypothetical protein